MEFVIHFNPNRVFQGTKFPDDRVFGEGLGCLSHAIHGDYLIVTTGFKTHPFPLWCIDYFEYKKR